MTQLRPEPATSPASPDSARLASEIKALLDAGRHQEAGERFGVLVEVWQRRALRLAYRYVGNMADADDAVQDAFVKLYAHMTSYRADLSFDAWFSRMIVTTCLDQLKARKRGVGRWSTALAADVAAWVASAEPSADRRLQAQDAVRTLTAAAHRLPPKQRDVFLLTHSREMAPREISQTLGMNVATVRVHLFRAVRRLRAVLESHR